MKKYFYYVRFSGFDKGSGSKTYDGYTELGLNAPITSIDQIKSMYAYIEQLYQLPSGTCNIDFYSFLREE